MDPNKKKSEVGYSIKNYFDIDDKDQLAEIVNKKISNLINKNLIKGDVL